MFKELIELGQRLESEGKLPPSGFYFYSDPIKWVIHIWQGPPLKYHIESPDNMQKSRPFSGRTVGTGEAHPLVDEAGYVFGIEKKKSGKDGNAGKKHESFKFLLNKAYHDQDIKDSDLKQAISVIQDIVEKGTLRDDPRYKEMLNKDWVSFVMEDGPLSGQHLFEHPEIRSFWLKELRENKSLNKQGEVVKGFCSICGKETYLAKNIVPGVKLYKPNPFHSYNKDSFVSFIEGSGVFKEKARLGQCFECGNIIANTLNYLTGNPQHCKILIQDKKAGKLNTDSFRNQFAIFWLKENEIIETEAEGEFDLNEPLSIVMESIEFSTNDETPPPDLKHLENLLNVPWKPEKSALRIAENEFCLIILSPNTGRITVREWFHVSLDRVKENLKKFLDSQRIVDPSGEQTKSFSIPDMLKAVEISNLDKPLYKIAAHPNPNLTRGLLRTAYLGDAPPSGLLELAVLCFRNPKILDKPDTMHIVAGVLKMLLTHDKEADIMKKMEGLNPERDIPAYLCGSLLAILEEAQLRALKWRINTTLVDRFYGAASSAPASVFGILLTRATTDHFPKIRRNHLGHKELSELFAEVQKKIDEQGGFRKTLTLAGQAEFSLGFYHQRADFRAQRAKNKQEQERKEEVNE